MAGENLSNPRSSNPDAGKWQNMDPNARTQQDANAILESMNKAKIEAEKRASLEAEKRAEAEAEIQKLNEDKERLEHAIEMLAKKQNEPNKEIIDLLKNAHVLDRLHKNWDQKKAGLEAKKNPHGFELQLEKFDDYEGIGDEDRKKCANYKAKLQRRTSSSDALEYLAEYYARNRRLYVVKDDDEAFSKAKARYTEDLGEYLDLKADIEYADYDEKANEILQKKHDELITEMNKKLDEFIGNDRNNDDDANKNNDDDDAAKDDKNQKNQNKTPKTPEEIAAEKERLTEEAAKQLADEYKRLGAEIDQKVNNSIIEELVARQVELEEATIDHLDNGTLYRRIVSKVISNKKFKAALAIGAAAGLALTGVGLVAGVAAGTVGFAGFSATGAALGAVKGGISGVVMSRQDSKNSAVRSFTNAAEIKQQIESMEQSDDYYDCRDVADWLLDQYESAKDTDFKNNRKRTKIAGGLGAAAGAIVGGIEINANTTEEVGDLDKLKAEKNDYNNQINNLNNSSGDPSVSGNNTQITASRLGEINIPEGHGAYDTFTQLGGDPADFDKFQEIMHSLDAKYGMVPGSNGETAGLNGAVGQYAHTYPGPIDTWPEAARNYITEVANEAARQGLIPSSNIETATNNVPDINKLHADLADVDDKIAKAEKVIADNNSANIVATVINGLIQWGWTFTSGGAAGVAANAVIDRVAANTSTNTPTQPPVQPASQPPAPQPQPQPQSAPQPQPPTPNQTPNQNPNQAPDQDAKQYRETVVKKLGSLIGDEGVDILSDTSAYEQIDDVKIRNWWKSLTPDAKKAVVDFESAVKAPDGDNGVKYGRALRTFFQINWVDLQDGSIPVTNPFL